MKKYATKDYVKHVEDSIGDFVKKEEFASLVHENTQLGKNVSQLISKEETIARLNLMNDDITKKLADRPTIEYFKKVNSSFNNKIDALSDQI